MEQVELNDTVGITSSRADLEDKQNTRLEEKNIFIFTIFRLLGFFPIKWSSVKRSYAVMPMAFIFYYMLWFLWPLAGLCVALYGRYAFQLDDKVDHVNDVIETSLFILGFAVVPAISTYAINLITRYLPDILEDISSLGEMDVGFKTPMNIHIPSRRRKSLSSKIAVIASMRSHRHDTLLFIVPVVTIVVSITAFITAWVYGILKVVEWKTIKQEWPFYVMQFTYLTQPVITTWFCVVFIEWLRMVYEALRVEFDYYYYTLLKSQEGKGKQIKNVESEVSFDVERLKHVGDYVDKMQEIFLWLIEGFVKFIASVNFLVCLVSSVFCTLELLKGFHLIMYVVPLAIAVTHMALICYMSNCLIDEYDKILLVLKKMVRLERRHPDLLPYSELHVLRENLLESPPQVVIFGGYPVGNGLLIAVHGFILSYAVLANDILDIEKGNKTVNALSSSL